MANKHWYGIVLDPDFDSMFNAPLLPVLQEEPYQAKNRNDHSTRAFRPSIKKLPAIGYTSPWPEHRRMAWKN